MTVSQTAAYLFAMLCGTAPALLAFLCLRPFRMRRLAARRLRSSAFREAALALFGMFCGGMAMVTLTPRYVVWSLSEWVCGCGWNGMGYPFFRLGTVNLTPFQTFGPDAHSLYILAGNIVLFLPFGFFAALLWRGCTARRALAAGACITGGIECWQLLVGRSFDIDDLMLNTLGVLCGYGLWRLLARRCPTLGERFWPRNLTEEAEKTQGGGDGETAGSRDDG